MELGKKILEELNITKEYTILESSRFELGKFNQTFDFEGAVRFYPFIIAANRRRYCGAQKTMNKGGIFVFTYIVSNKMSPRGFF